MDQFYVIIEKPNFIQTLYLSKTHFLFSFDLLQKRQHSAFDYLLLTEPTKTQCYSNDWPNGMQKVPNEALFNRQPILFSFCSDIFCLTRTASRQILVHYIRMVWGRCIFCYAVYQVNSNFLTWHWVLNFCPKLLKLEICDRICLYFSKIALF